MPWSWITKLAPHRIERGATHGSSHGATHWYLTIIHLLLIVGIHTTVEHILRILIVLSHEILIRHCLAGMHIRHRHLSMTHHLLWVVKVIRSHHRIVAVILVNEALHVGRNIWEEVNHLVVHLLTWHAELSILRTRHICHSTHHLLLFRAIFWLCLFLLNYRLTNPLRIVHSKLINLHLLKLFFRLFTWMLHEVVCELNHVFLECYVILLEF